MARSMKRDSTGRFTGAKRSVRNNPANPLDVLGVDMEKGMGIVAGIAFCGALTDKLVGPAIKANIPVTQQPMGKAVDAAATTVAAILAGTGVGMVSRYWGNLIKTGGMYLAGAKALSIPFSDVSLSATFPMLGWIPPWPSGANVAPAGETPALPAGNSPSTSLSQLGVGSTGL